MLARTQQLRGMSPLLLAEEKDPESTRKRTAVEGFGEKTCMHRGTILESGRKAVKYLPLRSSLPLIPPSPFGLTNFGTDL